MKKYIIIILAAGTSLFSCKKYLDKKTDKKLVVPVSLQDAQSLLDSYSLMNTSFPSIGTQSDDNFYLLDSYWNSLPQVNHDNYVWAKEVYNTTDWGNLYQAVLYANIALETTGQIPVTASNTDEWKRVRGSALFFRGSSFYQLAQYYAKPYDKGTAPATPGIPLRLNSDINEVSVRSNLQETYERIVTDLTESASLLPSSVSPLSRPSKAAAFAALSRAYLAMEDYTKAGVYADSSLQLYNTLVDYNTLNAAANQPFSRFNKEVIFQSIMLQVGMFSVSNLRVDSTLYQSYAANDLRRTLFFRSNGTGTVAFKGSYDGSANFFGGIATDEMFLTRAECRARTGDVSGALADLNTLLVKRFKTLTYVPVTGLPAEDALKIILIERRKELVFRGLRWFDLRRLNKDPGFAKTLVRKLNGVFYELPPNDPRYTEYIPLDVINMTGMQQNTR